jgi:hypothetical protein
MRRIGPALALAAALAGCGVSIQEPDLFQLTRAGEGRTLTMLVNYSGTIRCNGGATRTLPGSLVIEARNLAGPLSNDAQHRLRIPSPTNSVYRYTVRLGAGTITFPDTAAAAHPLLAQLEQFALRAAPSCG